MKTRLIALAIVLALFTLGLSTPSFAKGKTTKKSNKTTQMATTSTTAENSRYTKE